MRIVLLRHAEAETDGPDGSDASRRLTVKGRRQSRTSGKAIRRLGEKIELMLTSPLVRAVQTAQLAAGELGGAQMVELPALGIPFSREDLTRRLAEFQAAGTSCLCLVGHAPTLGDYAGWLIGSKASGTVELGKAGVACVELDEPPAFAAGRLIWLMTRKQLAKV